VLFDCHGDFVGGCCETRPFETRLHNIREIVLWACREQLLLSAYVDSKQRPTMMALLCTDRLGP
jgi:hypothetical protein